MDPSLSGFGLYLHNGGAMRMRLFGALGVAFLVQAGLFVAGQAPATAASQPYVCTGVIGSLQTIKGDVMVPLECDILGTVQGDVYDEPGALQIRISPTGLVKGDVVLSNLRSRLFVGPRATVTGNLHVHNVPSIQLVASNIGGDVEIAKNTAAAVSQNQVGGDVTITDSLNAVVRSNVIQGDLDCEGRVGSVSASDNDVHGDALGLCANP
jgi:cytoskeletal protein CcmA (bactofilin family)